MGKGDRFSKIGYAGIMVVLFLFISGSWMAYSYKYDVVPAFGEVSVPEGVRSVVWLPDETKVHLNQKSSLRYPMHASDSRIALLVGEGSFEANRRNKEPFRLQVGNNRLLSKGTFTAKTDWQGNLVSLVVTAGKVELSRLTEPDSAAIVLQANTAYLYEETSRLYIHKPVDPYTYSAWKEGKMVFRNNRFEEVLKQIGNQFDVEIKLQDTLMANRLYRATFKDETLNEILLLLQKTAPIDYYEEYVPGARRTIMIRKR